MSDANMLPAPVIELPEPANDKWQQERHAFWRLLPELLKTHRDRYVAIHEGKVVDWGDDSIALALRCYNRFGYVPIYVGLVIETPQVERARTPRMPA